MWPRTVIHSSCLTYKLFTNLFLRGTSENVIIIRVQSTVITTARLPLRVTFLMIVHHTSYERKRSVPATVFSGTQTLRKFVRGSG